MGHAEQQIGLSFRKGNLKVTGKQASRHHSLQGVNLVCVVPGQGTQNREACLVAADDFGPLFDFVSVLIGCDIQ